MEETQMPQGEETQAQPQTQPEVEKKPEEASTEGSAAPAEGAQA